MNGKVIGSSVENLNTVAAEFEMIDSETHLFYNTETGEFDLYCDSTRDDITDINKFNYKPWVSAPSWRELGEYNIMLDFTKTISDTNKSEKLYIALRGKDKFRSFGNTLRCVGLADLWYDFRRKAFIKIAADWCDKHDVPYSTNESDTLFPLTTSEKCNVVPLSSQMTAESAQILRDTLDISKYASVAEIKLMLAPDRISLAALSCGHVVGIVSALPQYGVTAWKLHFLSVLKSHRKHGFGSALLRALEKEVALCGGVTLYLSVNDSLGETSLFGKDLYQDTFAKISNIKNIGSHPFPFYEKLGYKIMGVIPDANGIGKPDIWMAKRVM